MIKKFKELFKPNSTPVFNEDEIENEPEYRNWWTKQYVLDLICGFSQNGIMLTAFSIVVLGSLVSAIMLIEVPQYDIGQMVYNIWYTLVVVSVAVTAARQYPAEPITWSMKVGFLMDLVTYLHFLPYYKTYVRGACYFIRVHRPIRFICTKDRETIYSSLVVTTFKYIYYTLLLRIICAYCWILIHVFVDEDDVEEEDLARRMIQPVALLQKRPDREGLERVVLRVFYIVNMIFLPIGPTAETGVAYRTVDRVMFILVMITGTLMVTGAAVASLSSVISVHMRAEENFRTRYRIIMNDLRSSEISENLRNKVETFYKMYWHKLRAVSASQLLHSFPPDLANSVYTDVYFEATQKSALLRDLSYQFLSELARHMDTILYIPGDCIIKRNSFKDAIIFITFGDIEMLTAEDDMSAMLRFTRGTVLTPWGACAAGGGRAHVQVRAATFCAARVLRARTLWRVTARARRAEAWQLRYDWRDHLNKVKRHYTMRKPNPTRFKSSILEFKRSLMALKEARDEDGELLLARPDYLLEIAGCYLMRNRADASLTDDSDPICLRQTFPCILQPKSSLLTAWNWAVTCLILVVCFIYPYYIIYKKTVPLEFRFFDLMVMSVYLLDIIVYLSTGTNVEEGVPITLMETASKQVRSPWFVVDVLGTAPIFSFIGDGGFAGINRVVRFPKVIRMIQSLEEECHSNAIRFLVCSLLLFYACYFIAALHQCYMCNVYDLCVVTNFTHPPFWTIGSLDDSAVKERLFFSVYWSISLLTFTCHLQQITEHLNFVSLMMYIMLLLEITIVLSIAIEAVYSSTIMVTTAFRENFDSCIEDARNFLDSHKLPPMLRQRFIQHLQLCWNTRKAYSMSTNQSSVFYDLPQHVYLDILARQRSKYLLCIPFMKLLNNEQLKNVSSNARAFYCAPYEVLLNTGDISMEMFIIKQGFCEVFNPDTKEVVGTLLSKSHFGVLECLFRLPAFYTVRTTTHALVFSIGRKHLLQALEIPQIKDAYNFVKEQEEYTRLQVRREPFVTYQPPPRVPNREIFKLPRKHEKDSAFLQPFKKFGFFSILKNVFPRFTFRPDSALLTRYEVCRSFCAVVGAFIFPSYTYMVLQVPAFYYITIVLDLSAYVDIIFRLFVGFFDVKGILVYHPGNTAAHYLRGAFVLDLMGCLPLEELEVSMKYSYGHLYQVTAIKQVLMLNRLLQLYRLPGTLDMLTSFVERRDLILVLKILPLFLTLLNVLTTFLVFSSVSVYQSEDAREWAFVPLNDTGGSWIYLYSKAYRFNVTATPWTLQLGCYFWVVYEATTTGYNIMAPTNLNIMGVLFCSIVFGSLTTIYMSVRIISLRANVNKALASYQEHMKDLIQFMKRENLDKQLQQEIKDHYEFNWEKTNGIDARNILKLCDQITLRSDAILHLYGPAFTKCPIFSNCDVSLFRILGRAVCSIYFLEGTPIFEEDDVIRHLYFVYSGQLQLRSHDLEHAVCNVTKLGVGSMVGNLDAVPTARVSCSLLATTDVQLLQMHSTLFHGIVGDCFPEVLQLMATHRPDKELFISGDADSSVQPSKHPATEYNKNLALQSAIVQFFFIITSQLCLYGTMYNAGFHNHSLRGLATLYMLDACFLVKFLLFLKLPHLVSLLQDREKAKQMYFKSIEFIVDVASCIPIEILCLLSVDNRWLWFCWLRLNRMLRALTIYKYLKRYEKSATENMAFSICTLIMWFTVYIHAFTCLWFFIAISQDRAVPRSSWLYNDDKQPVCRNDYICSVYFILTSFAHNGIADIVPRSQIEVMFVSAILIIFKLLSVVYVGEFANIIHYASFRSFSYYSKYLELQEYLKNNRVSPVLVQLVNKYAVLLWRTARGEQLPEFLVKSPVCLKLKIMNHAYKNVGDKHPVFKDFEPALLRQIVGYLRQYYCDENMYVVKQSEITNSMYLVHTGEVQEVGEDCYDEEDANLNRRVYTAGEYFGVAQGLIHDMPFEFSYRTLVRSQVLTLNLDDWEYLLKHFPDSKKLINDFRSASRGDDDDEDRARKGNRPPPIKGPDTYSLLGTPGGSETSLDYRWATSDEPPDDPPDTPPSKPPPTSPDKPDESPLVELKRSAYFEFAKPPDDDEEGKTKTKRESKVVKLRDDTKSITSLMSVGMGEKKKSALRITDRPFKSDVSVKFEIDKGVQVSSSTELYERIRNAAMDVDNRLASQTKQDNAEASNKPATSSTPLHSVEEYLAYKYKMRDSYVYSPKVEYDDDTVTDIRPSPSRLAQKKYSNAVHDGSNREHFKHSQLAESKYHIKSPQYHTGSVLNLERPFGEHTPSRNSLADINLKTASVEALQQRKILPSTVERVDSQEPMTSKRAKQLSDKVQPVTNEEGEFDGTRADSEKKQMENSDVAPKAREATESLAILASADIIEKQKSNIPPEFLSAVKEIRTASANYHPTVPVPLPAYPPPSTEPPALQPEHAVPDPQTPTDTHFTPLHRLRDFLARILLRLMWPRAPALNSAEHAHHETQTETETVTSVREPSITSKHLLEDDTALTSVATPSKDQPTSAALRGVQAEMLLTSRNEITPQETQAGEGSRGTGSDDVTTNANVTTIIPYSSDVLEDKPATPAVVPTEYETPDHAVSAETELLPYSLPATIVAQSPEPPSNETQGDENLGTNSNEEKTDAKVTDIQDPSITSIRLLEEDIAPTPIVVPPEDQAKDLAALTEVEMILKFTSKTTPTETQEGEKGQGIDSKEEKPDTEVHSDTIVREPAITSIKTLGGKPPTPPEVQITDNAVSAETDILPNSASATKVTKATEPTSNETQADEESRGADSKELTQNAAAGEKTNADTTNSGQNKSNEQKTDQDETTDDNDKERKEKRD